MVTDAVGHVADVALQCQREVGAWQPGDQGAGLWLPLQPPQDAVSPCRLSFFLT